MIKRIAVVTLLLVYLGTTAGFALSLHFCGTKISNIRINQSAKKACCNKETDSKPDKCCNDKHIKIKVSDQQQAIQSAKIPQVSSQDLFFISHHLLSPALPAVNGVSTLSYRGPPVCSAIPLTIKNCVFRI